MEALDTFMCQWLVKCGKCKLLHASLHRGCGALAMTLCKLFPISSPDLTDRIDSMWRDTSLAVVSPRIPLRPTRTLLK